MATTRHAKIEAIKARKRLLQAPQEQPNTAEVDPNTVTTPSDSTMLSIEVQPTVHVVTPPRKEIDAMEQEPEDAQLSSTARVLTSEHGVVSIQVHDGEETIGVAPVTPTATPSHEGLSDSRDRAKTMPEKSSRSRQLVRKTSIKKARSRKVSLKQSPPRSKRPISKRAKGERRLRQGGDDDSTVESRHERRVRRSDGLASALDPLIDYLLDDASAGDDSFSVRTNDKVDIIKDIEDFLYDCAKPADVAGSEEWRGRTASMDDSTTHSDGNKRPVRPKKPSSPRLPKAKDMRAVVVEDEATLDSCARASWKIMDESFGTATVITDRDVTEATSFDSREPKPFCGDVYQVATDLIGIDDSGDRNKKIKKSARVVKNAKARGAKSPKDAVSDSSFTSSLQTSMKDTSSYASTLFSSLRGGAISIGTGVISSETHSVRQNAHPHAEGPVYAPADDMMSEGSFFTHNADSGKRFSCNPFEGALANLKESLDKASAAAKLQEFQAGFQGIKLVPNDNQLQRLYEALSCGRTSEAPKASSPVKTEKSGLTMADKVNTLLTCGILEADAPFDEMEPTANKNVSFAQKIQNVLTCNETIPEGDEDDVTTVELRAPSDSYQPEARQVTSRPETPVYEQTQDAEVHTAEPENLDVNPAEPQDVEVGRAEPQDDGVDPAEPQESFSTNAGIAMPGTPLKVVAGDPLGSLSVDTPETGNSTEDETYEADETAHVSSDVEETETHFLEITDEWPTIEQPLAKEKAVAVPKEKAVAQVRPVEVAGPEEEILAEEELPAQKKGDKKWNPLRRVVKPLFRKKKNQEEVQMKAAKKSLASARGGSGVSVGQSSTVADGSENQGTASTNASTANPIVTSAGPKAKHTGSIEEDEFDEIITRNARAADWECMFPEFAEPVVTSTTVAV